MQRHHGADAPTVRDVRGPAVRRVRPTARVLALIVVLAAAGVFLATPAAAVANRTAAFWSMDEAAGATTLVDSSGNGRNGAIGSDVTPATVYDGATAHRFATVLPDDQAAYPGHVNRVPNSSELNPDSGDFSVTVRLRTTFSFGNIIQKGQGSDPRGYWKMQASGATPSCLFRGSNGASRTGYSNNPIDDGQWHTIKCVRTSTYVEMYVDGVRTNRANGPTGTIDNNKELSIGGKGTCDGVTVTCDYFAGDIDYVRIEKGTTTAQNAAPTASFSTACTGLVCTTDGSGSSDTDGAIQRYVWDFGDGTVVDSVSVPHSTHTYTAAGTYTMRLTVTDDRGATSSTTRDVSVEPVPERISYVGGAMSNANATAHTVTVPADVQAGDTLLLFLADNKNTSTVTGPAGWTQVSTLNGGSARTTVWRTPAAAAAAGSNVQVRLSVQAKANLAVHAYRGVDPTEPIAAFAHATDTASTASRITPVAPVTSTQAWAVSYWMHGDGVTTQLTPPAGVSVRSNGTQTGSGRATALVADSNASVPEGSYGGLVATAAAPSTTTTTWTLVLRADLAPPPENEPPTAVLGVTCDGLDCITSAAGSTDLEAPIASYSWDFGDGTTPLSGTEASSSHTYLEAGTYTVTLTVTDAAGATASAAQEVAVEVPPPVVDVITYVGQATANADSTTHSVTIPADVQAGDGLVLVFTEASLVTVPEPTGVTGWQALQTVDGGAARSQVWRKVAGAADAGAVARLTLSSKVKANLVVAAYRGTDATDPVLAFGAAGTATTSATRVTPVVSVPRTGTWAVSYWAHRDSTTTTLTPPDGVTVRSNSAYTGGGHITGLLADSAGLVPKRDYGGLTAVAPVASSGATTWTIVLNPGPAPA
jgi:PKD repeat protein